MLSETFVLYNITLQCMSTFCLLASISSSTKDLDSTVYLAHLGLKDHILNMPLLSIHRHQVYLFILNLI